MAVSDIGVIYTLLKCHNMNGIIERINRWVRGEYEFVVDNRNPTSCQIECMAKNKIRLLQRLMYAREKKSSIESTDLEKIGRT